LDPYREGGIESIHPQWIEQCARCREHEDATRRARPQRAGEGKEQTLAKVVEQAELQAAHQAYMYVRNGHETGKIFFFNTLIVWCPEPVWATVRCVS
jgi:hypothetical protein